MPRMSSVLRTAANTADQGQTDFTAALP